MRSDDHGSFPVFAFAKKPRDSSPKMVRNC